MTGQGPRESLIEDWTLPREAQAHFSSNVTGSSDEEILSQKCRAQNIRGHSSLNDLCPGMHTEGATPWPQEGPELPWNP